MTCMLDCQRSIMLKSISKKYIFSTISLFEFWFFTPPHLSWMAQKSILNFQPISTTVFRLHCYSDFQTICTTVLCLDRAIASMFPPRNLRHLALSFSFFFYSFTLLLFHSLTKSSFHFVSVVIARENPHICFDKKKTLLS